MLARRRSLIYPGGSPPGFDPSHPAAVGIVPGHGFSGAALPGGMISLLTGKAQSGGTSHTIDGIMGPAISLAGFQQATFSGQSTAADQECTIAAIGSITIGESAYFFASDGGAAAGFSMTVNTLNKIAINKSNVLGGTAGPALPSGVPCFVACSCSLGNVVNMVVCRLDTGAIQTLGATLGGTALAPGGAYTVAGPNATVLREAAVMFSPKYMSMQQLLAWAADPWSFWYPYAGTMRPAFFSQPAAAGGSSTLTAVGGTFTLTGEASLFEQFLAASSGPFTLTGEASLFEQFLAASSGSFTLTGEAAAFFLSGGLAAAGATFTLTGEASLFEQFLASAAGAFVLTGGAATLTWALPAAGAGTFAETGEPATFKEALTSAAGSFTETGFAALLGAPAQAFIVTGGTFILTGFASIELLSSGWRNAIPAVTQWSSATKPASNWTLEPPVVPWSRG